MKALFERHRHGLNQLVKFCVVGASGVAVNFVVAYACKKLAPLIWPGAQEGMVFLDLPFVDVNIRWYHVFSMIAFIVANLSNYQFNRSWSFKSKKHLSWLRELFPFFVVGLLAQLIGMGVETALMHPRSPIGLSDSFFDGSSGFRTKWYWAHLLMICVTIPVSFLLNKYWTFRSTRGGEDGLGSDEGAQTPGGLADEPASGLGVALADSPAEPQG